MLFPRSCFALAIVVLALASCTKQRIKTRPNILLLVADDLGYADLGCYGGDIRTPNIDSLAGRGMRFSQFHTASYCAPTRAMLLTGNNNHVAGMGIQGGARKGSWEESQPGYEGYLSDRVIPFPQILREAGYHTYTVGKWHLGKDRVHGPSRKGFERSFNLLQGAGNHYNSIGLVGRDSVSLYAHDGELVDFPPGAYSTEFYTDQLMEFIKQGNDGKPFFAYAAYTSPHWPLQAPRAFDRYQGKYDEGYDSLRLMRLASLKKAGIIADNYAVPPRLNTIKPWKDLNAQERRIESRKMELYAAMVDNLDFHVGRLIQFLKAQGLYENTLIVFMSDNGAAAEDFYNTPPYASFLQTQYNNQYENMGEATSFISYGPAWAKAGAAPFSHHKSYPTEGGTVAPMIISGPGVATSGSIQKEFVTVMDLAPTFIELAEAIYPGAQASPAVRPMLGESMVSFLTRNSDLVHDTTYVTGFEHGGSAYCRKGKWKIVNLKGPHDERTFALYNLEVDPAEVNDLRGQMPAKFDEMLKIWKTYRQANGILVAPSIP